MLKQRNVFTNRRWSSMFFYFPMDDSEYKERIGINYNIDPINDHVASQNNSVFNLKKAAAMYFWYKTGDRYDTSILKFFPEYKRCIDSNHNFFFSNYGFYANSGLEKCIDTLLADRESRQACFMINNKEAMSKNSIDKLCTNDVMFFIRDNALLMIVQMRSSNMLTLLPYDAFIFSIWYAKVYNKLIRRYSLLEVRPIIMHVGSLHFYKSDFEFKASNNKFHDVETVFGYKDICDHNFENILENKLIKFLKS